MNRTLTIASFRTVSYVNGGRVPITIPPNCEGDSSTFQASRQSSRPPRPNARTQNKNKSLLPRNKKIWRKTKRNKKLFFQKQRPSARERWREKCLPVRTNAMGHEHKLQECKLDY